MNDPQPANQPSRAGFLAGCLVLVLLFGLAGFFPTHRQLSQFGEIWQAYSFHPDVSVTPYQSKSGNATIIWVSGLDHVEAQPEKK